MKHGVLALLALLAAACDKRPDEDPIARPEWPAFELGPVVLDAIGEGERQLALGDWPAEADPEHVRGLVTMVAGTDTVMREIALEEAAAEGDAFVPELVRIAENAEEQPHERHAALQILGRLDTPRSGEALLSAVVAGKEPWLRAHGAWRLGETTQDWVVPHLFLRLKYETDHDTVVWLAKTLAHFGNYSGMRALSAIAAQSQDEVMRASAAARMAEVVEAAGFTTVEELWQSWTAGDDIPAFRPPRSPRFDLELWRRIERLSEFQLRGVDDSRYVFEGLGFRTAELLGQALHDEDVYIRVHCAQGLQRMGRRGAPAGPTLVAGLAEPELGPHAAAALGAIAFEPAVPVLVQCLAPGNRPDLRLAAARALRGFGPELGATASEPLRALLDGGETDELRQAAAESLVYLGSGDDLVAPLCDFMLSPRVEPVTSENAVRFWLAARAAAGNERAQEVLGRWDALLIPNDAIVAAADKLASREERRALVLEALPAITP